MEEIALTNNEHAENPLSRAVTVDKDGNLFITKCKICMSQHRGEAEAIYEQSKSLSAAKQLLDSKQEVLAIWQIRHHFEKHYRNMEQQAAIAEYRDQLNQMMQRRRTMVDDILYSIEIAWMELTNILVVSTGTDLDKMEKKQRMISEKQKTIKEGYEFIQSLHDSEAKVKALEEKFARVWSIKLEKATPEERKVLTSTLQDFKKELNSLGDT